MFQKKKIGTQQQQKRTLRKKIRPTEAKRDKDTHRKHKTSPKKKWDDERNNREIIHGQPRKLVDKCGVWILFVVIFVPLRMHSVASSKVFVCVSVFQFAFRVSEYRMCVCACVCWTFSLLCLSPLLDDLSFNVRWIWCGRFIFFSLSLCFSHTLGSPPCTMSLYFVLFALSVHFHFYPISVCTISCFIWPVCIFNSEKLFFLCATCSLGGCCRLLCVCAFFFIILLRRFFSAFIARKRKQWSTIVWIFVSRDT